MRFVAMQRPAMMALALALLSLLLPLSAPTAWPVSVSSPSLFLRAAAAPSAPAVAGSINAIFLELFRQSLLAYQLQVPSFSGVTLSSNSGEGGRTAAASGNFDWTVATNSVPDTMRVTHPTLESYPIASVGVAPSYNLPAESVGAATLTLHSEVMCRMWRGNITHWNDSAITETNPSLTLPGERIVFIQLGYVNDASLAATRLCTKVDPGWAATVGVSTFPDLANVVRVSQTQNSAGLAAKILDTPFSIGFLSPVVVKTRKANLINQAGKSVQATPATVAQAFLELSANGILPGGNGFDLSNPQSAYAWPANMPGFLFLDKDTTRSTCSAKAEVLKFLLWMYESPVVASLAESGNIALPPAMYLKQTGLLDQMRREILCEGASLVEADSTSASIRGNAMVASSVSLMTQLYGQIDLTYSYSFKQMSDSLALDRIAVGEIDFAIISNTALSAEQTTRFLAPTVDSSTGAVVPGGMILPAFLVGVVPTFSLPVAVTALHATRSASDDLGLPDLYPLTIDIETLGEIFAGDIRSWTDSRITKLNPRLAVWFERANAPTELRAVVCCSDDTDPFVAGYILARHLLTTRAINTTLGAAGIAAADANPRTLWKALQARHAAPSPMSFVGREATVPAKLLIQPGSVSYRMINSAAPVSSSDFRLQITNTLGEVETVLASPDNTKACIAPFVSEPGFLAAYSAGGGKLSGAIAPGCWPLQAMSSLAVGSTFSSATEVESGVTTVVAATGGAAASHQSACVRAQKNLELLRWMQLSPVLSGAMRNSGVVRLSDLPEVRSFLVDQRLNTATCDGKTILITLPILWSVPNSATIFAIVIAAFIIVACLATIAGLYKYRHHTAIRGASPLFLAQVAVGLALLAGSMIAWASPVTESSCLTFQWLVDLGFTLAFAPLFAKTWRIYQIFSAKKIKVVKITNGRLVWVVLAMLAFELAVLSAWTGISPLHPVLFEQPTNQLDGAIRQLSHCAVEGAAGTAFLAIEAAFKGALLLFGCLMAFSTRKVASSFNESQTIAWSIYNVVFSSLVVGAILLFLDTLGDTLIWLVLMLFLWAAAGTWALIFVPKVSAVFGGEEHLQHNANSISIGSLSKHDGSITFASITGLGRSQLLAYRTALESQLDKVKRALGIATVRADSEGKILNPRSSNESDLFEMSVGSTALASGRTGMRARPLASADDSQDGGRSTSLVSRHVTSPTAVSQAGSASANLFPRPPTRKVAPAGAASGLRIDASIQKIQVARSPSQAGVRGSPSGLVSAQQPQLLPEDDEFPALPPPAVGALGLASPSSSFSSDAVSPVTLWPHDSAAVQPATLWPVDESKPTIDGVDDSALAASDSSSSVSSPPAESARGDAVPPSIVAAAAVLSSRSPVRVAVSLAAKPSSRAPIASSVLTMQMRDIDE